MNHTMHGLRAVAGAVLALSLGALPAGSAPLSDAAVKERMIRESIANYPGNCPCPYNAARNGSSCGARSAYTRPGGYAPLCYASDISKADVDAYRRSHGL